MKKILLDSNIIIKYPKLLALKIPDTEFVTTIDVLSELNERRNSPKSALNDRNKLIDDAIADGRVELINNTLPAIQKYAREFPHRNLSFGDVSLVSTALFLKEKAEIQIATIDKAIIDLSSSLGYSILHDDEIQLFLQLFPLLEKQKDKLAKKVANYESLEKRSLWLSIATSLLTALAGIFTGNFFKVLLAHINVIGLSLIFFVTGIVFFLWREKFRFSYGLFEFLIGFGAIVMTLYNDGFDYIKLINNPEVDIKLIGGLYIMVRGQDNIVKGLNGTKVGVYLKEKFGIG